MKTNLDKLANLNHLQKAQVEGQWEKMQHESYKIDIPISVYDSLNGFAVHKGVWNPLYVSGRHHAAYLFYHNSLYYNKTAIDMGTGTGLMAVVMALYGAKHVIASDISAKAIENTKENVKIFGLENKIEVVKGNLFENIKEKADFIVFNLPYFADTPPEGDTIAASMLNNGELIQRFLASAPSYLVKGGVIVIPSFDLAGPINDPSIQGPKFGYNVQTTWQVKSEQGMQQGILKMHELRLR